jgi:hypothetical protein
VHVKVDPIICRTTSTTKEEGREREEERGEGEEGRKEEKFKNV